MKRLPAYQHLNRSDVLPDDARYPDAWRRVLPYLGEYVAQIVYALNLRPQSIQLLAETATQVLLLIKLPGEQVVLKLAPDGELAGEVFFCRTLAGQPVPVPRLIRHDLTCSLVPFPYLIENYFGGINAHQVQEPHTQRALGQQVGRVLRQIHRHTAPGFGQPTANGRWPTRGWPAILALLHASSGAAMYSPLLFTSEQAAALRVATLDHAGLMRDQPRLIHGSLRPTTLVCTLGEHVRLEALVDPGPLVGGDPLYDLACALLPTFTTSFHEGLRDGYAALGGLSAEDSTRLVRLRLLTSWWETCRLYAQGHDHELLRAVTLDLLRDLAGDAGDAGDAGGG